MLNIQELERRWLIYKIKSYLPKLLPIFASLLIGIILFFYLSSESEPQENALSQIPGVVKEEPVIAIAAPIQVPDEIEIAVPANTQALPVSTNETPLRLKPSLRFMDRIEEDISTYSTKDDYTNQPEPIEVYPPSNDSVPLVSRQKNDLPKSEAEEPSEESGMLTITKQEDESDLKDIIRRFKTNKNPALSLFIAKRYYNAQQYQKSYNYALMTNEIDQNIDESWIIFSKSLVKLGQHELAINTLKAYLKTSKSTAAEVLLRNIESGDFR